MAGRTPWREVQARRGPIAPERQAARDAYGRAMAEAERIAQAQEAGATRVEIAELPADPDEGRRDDLYLAELGAWVAALGGRLVLAAEFPAAGPARAPETTAARSGGGIPTE